MKQNITVFKRQAAEHAVTFVESGMVVGLGHGSTAVWAVRRIAELLRQGELYEVMGVPCSLAVEREAHALGIPLTTLDRHPVIDLTIDGADEVDPAFDVIKGGGGALLREKIVGQASRRYVIVVDESKLSPALGTRWPVPIEALGFGLRATTEFLESLGAKPVPRRRANGKAFITDQGNPILDCAFGPIADARALAETLDARAGIIGHGLFLNMATDLAVAGSQGVRHLVRPAPSGNP